MPGAPHTPRGVPAVSEGGYKLDEVARAAHCVVRGCDVGPGAGQES